MLKDLIIEFKSNSYGVLISMTDFVLAYAILHKEQKRNFNLGLLDFTTNSKKYARLLKQPFRAMDSGTKTHKDTDNFLSR
jgi:hypothetical protein